MEKKKLATLIFSFIPGVGHYYLGLMSRGLQFMLLFSATVFVITFMRIEPLMIFLPVIWFYSVFDALQNRQLVNEGIAEDKSLGFIKYEKLNQKWVAYGLIGVGVYIIVESFILPFFRYIPFVNAYQLREVLIAGFFIFIGFRLLSLTKGKQTRNDEIKEGETSHE